MIPLKYNVRNVRVRWVTTLMTALVIALVVWSAVLTFGLIDGLEHALRVGGHPLDLIVMRKGSQEETSSGIEQPIAREVATLDGIARDAEGRPMCSVEYVTILSKPRRNNAETTNLIVRGLEQEGRGLRPGFRAVEGRDIQPGINEAITSCRMAERFENLRRGEKLEVDQADGRRLLRSRRERCRVGGLDRPPRSDNRPPYTGARLRRESAGRGRGRQARADRPHRKDEQFNLKVVDEPTYFEEQMDSSLQIKIIGYFIAGRGPEAAGRAARPSERQAGRGAHLGLSAYQNLGGEGASLRAAQGTDWHFQLHGASDARGTVVFPADCELMQCLCLWRSTPEGVWRRSSTPEDSAARRPSQWRCSRPALFRGG